MSGNDKNKFFSQLFMEVNPCQIEQLLQEMFDLSQPEITICQLIFVYLIVISTTERCS